MADRRIQVALDKSEFLQELKKDGSSEGPFDEYYDALVFAATLAASKNQSSPLGKISKERPCTNSYECVCESRFRYRDQHSSSL